MELSRMIEDARSVGSIGINRAKEICKAVSMPVKVLDIDLL